MTQHLLRLDSFPLTVGYPLQICSRCPHFVFFYYITLPPNGWGDIFFGKSPKKTRAARSRYVRWTEEGEFSFDLERLKKRMCSADGVLLGW